MIARFSILCGLVLAGFAVWWFDSRSKADHVTFVGLHPAFVAKAMSSRKPMLIFVTSSRDRACQDLDKGAFMDARVMAALEPFARFKLDVALDNNPLIEQMAAMMELGAAPTLLFTNESGNEVARLTGTLSSDAIVAAATKALAGGPAVVEPRKLEQQMRVLEGQSRGRQRREAR